MKDLYSQCNNNFVFNGSTSSRASPSLKVTLPDSATAVMTLQQMTSDKSYGTRISRSKPQWSFVGNT